MDMKIGSKACCHVQVNFTVDARHILLAITELTPDKLNKITRKMVEEELKKQLWMKGTDWHDAPINYGEAGNHYNLREELEKALPIGKKLFPEFFGVPNSIRFIKDS